MRPIYLKVLDCRLYFAGRCVRFGDEHIPFSNAERDWRHLTRDVCLLPNPAFVTVPFADDIEDKASLVTGRRGTDIRRDFFLGYCKCVFDKCRTQETHRQIT